MSTSSASFVAEEDFEVEKVLNKKEFEGVTYYKIKWVGHKDPTWEAAENCDCAYLIKEFEDKINEKLDYEEEDEWEVEEILNKRVHKGRVEYLLKWKGWSGKPTWEIADNCECINLIAAYENPKLKQMWGFTGCNRNLWVNRKQMLDYMENYLEGHPRHKVNLLKFEPDYPQNEKQLPLKEGLNIGPLCYENHWYLVVILIDYICVTRCILVGDALNTLIGANTAAHPVMRRLKRVYTKFSVRPFKMTQMNRSDVCAYYVLAAFERALFLYRSSAPFVAESIFFDAPRAELVRVIVKPETHGEISVNLPIAQAFDHGPKCEFCEKLFETRQTVDEHIRQQHFKHSHKRARLS